MKSSTAEFAEVRREDEAMIHSSRSFSANLCVLCSSIEFYENEPRMAQLVAGEGNGVGA